jgi:hypothetical protein
MKPARANQYPERDVQAALSVLIELGVILADMQHRVVLIGGFVPWLTLSGPPAHVGTLDVDLNFDIGSFAVGESTHLFERLENAGYERGRIPKWPFRWRRWVPQVGHDGAPLEPIAVLVDLLVPHTPGSSSGLDNSLVNGADMQPATGAHLALRWNQTVPLEGSTPDGTFHRVTWRVASLPALLGMKGHSMSADRAKDAYDIYHVLRRYPGGPRALAEACRELLTDEVAVSAYRRIRDHFRADDDLGPQLIGHFLNESSALGDLSEEQVMQDAYQRVRAWGLALEI